MKKWLILLLILSNKFALISCKNQQETKSDINAKNIQTKQEDMKDDQYWKDKLTPEEFYILREKGTERPFSGKYNDFNEKGTYVCAACGAQLFASSSKFDSHCGWPSFDDALEGAVKYTKDNSHGMQRIEVTCTNCNGHLGHVFEDGPKETTGLRYCTNSISIKFIPDDK